MYCFLCVLVDIFICWCCVADVVVVIYNQKPTHSFFVHSFSLQSLMYTHTCTNHQLPNIPHHFDMDDFDKDLERAHTIILTFIVSVSAVVTIVFVFLCSCWPHHMLLLLFWMMLLLLFITRSQLTLFLFTVFPFKVWCTHTLVWITNLQTFPTILTGTTLTRILICPSSIRNKVRKSMQRNINITVDTVFAAVITAFLYSC